MTTEDSRRPRGTIHDDMTMSIQVYTGPQKKIQDIIRPYETIQDITGLDCIVYDHIRPYRTLQSHCLEMPRLFSLSSLPGNAKIAHPFKYGNNITKIPTLLKLWNIFIFLIFNHFFA